MGFEKAKSYRVVNGKKVYNVKKPISPGSKRYTIVPGPVPKNKK